MAARLPLLQCLRRAQYTHPSSRAFTTSSINQTQSVPVIRRKRRDPYAIAQAKARKAANLSRQRVLEKERAESLGDPVRGIETPFVKSFDNPLKAQDAQRQNFLVDQKELAKTLEQSRWLNTPSPQELEVSSTTTYLGGASVEDRMKMIKAANDTADEALRRISNLSLGSSRDKTRFNVQRCIDKFGRHNTDAVLPPKPRAEASTGTNRPTHNWRAGKDTGSSEVQIAILTARIRTMANNIALWGNQDKHNKRNLRLIVHRRQKLLQYLRRKERGGPRWQNLIETLGLTEGTWKGEIDLPR